MEDLQEGSPKKWKGSFWLSTVIVQLVGECLLNFRGEFIV